MDTTANSLQSVLILLASGVLALAVCRILKLPAMIGYVVTGLALGPHALALVSDRDDIRHLAEFGVVFLMFSIGLEFSLAACSRCPPPRSCRGCSRSASSSRARTGGR